MIRDTLEMAAEITSLAMFSAAVALWALILSPIG